MRAVIYARYSSELQSEASIEDQVRICRATIDQRGWSTTQVYSDMGMSGASHLRPGYQQLLHDARANEFDVLVAESIDRLSRDQEHIAALHKQLTYCGIPIVTLAEGDVSELHIGLKGTMSALYLKDLAQKTHRGLEGRVRKGKSAGGISYGYNLKPGADAGGNFEAGEREICTDEAKTINRIFRDYAAGNSPRAIAATLNKEGIAGPRGGAWGASTIYGNWRRGTGILNNELYIGRLVWNRQRYVKDPRTGKRQARLNPPEEWITEEVPDLRIVNQETWEAVKERQQATRNVMNRQGRRRPEYARRPRHLFSGLLRCGVCGASYTLVGSTRYGCAAVRNKGTCDNRRTIRRETLEEAVLSGLREHLLHPDLIRDFVEEYQREYNRIAREAAASLTGIKSELAKVTRKIEQMVDAISDGMYHPSMKERMSALEARKAELELLLQERPSEEPLRLHPGLSELYRAKVADLSRSLNNPDLRAEAAELLRGLLSEIRLLPDGDGLAIELVGELAGIIGLGEKNDPRSEIDRGSVTMVAGVGFEPTTFRL